MTAISVAQGETQDAMGGDWWRSTDPRTAASSADPNRRLAGLEHMLKGEGAVDRGIASFSHQVAQ
jgi:hypothetical protein